MSSYALCRVVTCRLPTCSFHSLGPSLSVLVVSATQHPSTITFAMVVNKAITYLVEGSSTDAVQIRVLGAPKNAIESNKILRNINNTPTPFYLTPPRDCTLPLQPQVKYNLLLLQPQMVRIPLLRRGAIRALHQRILASPRLRKRNNIPHTLPATHNRHQAIPAQCYTCMWRAPAPQNVE